MNLRIKGSSLTIECSPCLVDYIKAYCTRTAEKSNILKLSVHVGLQINVVRFEHWLGSLYCVIKQLTLTLTLINQTSNFSVV